MGTKLKTQPKQLNSAEIAAFHYSFSLLPDYFAVLHRRLRIAVVYGGDNREPNAVIQPTHHPAHGKVIAPLPKTSPMHLRKSVSSTLKRCPTT